MGRCLVGIVASTMGFEPTPNHPKIQRWMHEGTLHEGDILEKLKGEHVHVVQADDDGKVQWQVQIPLPGITVVGHFDGLTDVHAGADLELEGKPVEVKSVGDWTWKNKVNRLGIEKWVRGDRAYAYQFQSYLDGCAEGDGVYAAKNRNTGEWTFDSLNRPLAPDAVQNRCEEILEWIERGYLPPCEGGCSDFSSPWWHVHERPKTAKPQVVREQRVKELVTAYKDASDVERVQKETKDRIKKELAPMIEEGKWLVNAGRDQPVSVTKEDKVVRRLDEGKLREMFGDEAVDQCYESKTYPGSVTIR